MSDTSVAYPLHDAWEIATTEQLALRALPKAGQSNLGAGSWLDVNIFPCKEMYLGYCQAL